MFHVASGQIERRRLRWMNSCENESPCEAIEAKRARSVMNLDGNKEKEIRVVLKDGIAPHGAESCVPSGRVLNYLATGKDFDLVVVDACELNSAYESADLVEIILARMYRHQAMSVDEKSGRHLNYSYGLNNSLHLANCNISSTECVRLAREIRNSTKVHNLDISSNFIADQGASALSAVLLVNSTLESLNAGSNGISVAGISCLSSALRTNNALKFLELSFNGFGDAGASSIADMMICNNTIQHLGLGFNGIMEPGCVSLSRAMQVNTSLRTLELSYNAIGDDGLKILASALVDCPTLMTLGLVSNGITDEGCKYLAEALEQNVGVEVIGLSSNLIEDAGALTLAKALYKNDRLKALYLEENEIGEEGELAIQLALKETKCVDRLESELQEAFLMGFHKRLGQECWLYQLDKYLCSEILMLANETLDRSIIYYQKFET